jgi:hypothetical protein
MDAMMLLTSAQRQARTRNMVAAAMATDGLNDLPPDVVLTTFEAHLIGRIDITPEALEKMSDKLRQVAWARERGEL